MIYDWNNVKFDLADPDKSAFVKADMKPDPERKYFVTTIAANALLSPEQKYVHPSVNDVFVSGEKLYGLDFIISSKKMGQLWEFQLLLHELKKEQFAAMKTFARPQN